MYAVRTLAWAAVMQWWAIYRKNIDTTYIHRYIHRLYLKHGKPSVILHNKYSLNYCKLKKKKMNSHSKYIKYNKINMKLLFYQVAVWVSDKS